MKKLESYILSEGNVENVEFKSEHEKFMKFSLLPKFDGIKTKLGVSYIGVMKKAVSNLTPEQKAEFLEKKSVEIIVKVKGKDETITLDSDLVLE